MQPLPWNDLQAFLAVAHGRQLARAAAAMGVDATTIGRRIRRLEARLGRTLFEHTREGQVLTEAGERLLVQAEAMQRAADAIAEQRTGPGGLSGLLRISVSEGFGTWFVAHHLHAFASAHPALTIDLVASSGFLSPSKRETDVAVLLARPRAGPVVSAKLTDYTLRLYGARDLMTSDGVPTSASELAEQRRLVGYIPDLLYAPELRYLTEIDGRLQPQLRSSSINAQHQLIASGAGLGVLPQFIGDADASLARVLDDVVITRSFWIVTHQDTRALARVQAFTQWLRDVVKRHREALAG